MLTNQLKALVANYLLHANNYKITFDYNYTYSNKPKIILTYNNHEILLSCNYDSRFCMSNLNFVTKSKVELGYPLLLNDNDISTSRFWLDRHSKEHLILTNYTFTMHLPIYLTKIIFKLIPYFNIVTTCTDNIDKANVYITKLKELETSLVNGKFVDD
jgi:hypothetical protein